MKKVLTYVLSMVMVAALAIGGTLAYLQDQDSDVNVMTLGNVDIEQLEYERTFNSAGDVTGMQKFTQGQALYPAVATNNVEANKVWLPNGSVDTWYKDYLGETYPGGNGTWQNLNNTLDKFVFVKNTGKSDAYYRTILLFEADTTGFKNANTGQSLIHTNVNGHDLFTWTPEEGDFDENTMTVEVKGVKYYVLVATYNAKLKPGEISRPSLLQVGMDQLATNEHCEQFGNTYDILVLSQAVQTEGFARATTALDAAFGEVTVDNVKSWFEDTKIPTVKTNNGVNYISEGDTVTVDSNGGDTIYRWIISDKLATTSNIVINEGIVRLDNRALCKDPKLTTVSLPSTLTYIDEGVFQQSGFKKIVIPENVEYIGKTAFGACPNLETIVIKAKDVTLANYVARDVPNLKEVYIYSDNVTFEKDTNAEIYFSNTQNGAVSKITFYVSSQAVADALYNNTEYSNHYGMLIKSIDGNTVYYNLK